MSDQLVFNLQSTTLLASQRRAVHTDDRLVEVYQRDADVELLVAEPDRFIGGAALRRLQGEPAPHLERGTGLYRPRRLRWQNPTSIGNAIAAARRWERGLHRVVAQTGLHSPHVVVCNPFLAGFVELPWARSVVYFTHDDLATGEEGRRWRLVLEASYARVRARGRAVASVAPAMLDRISTPGAQTLIPNGVEVNDFGRQAVPDTRLIGLPGPIAVYVGALQGRIEAAAVAAVARGLGGGTIVLVGPERDDRTRRAVAGVDRVVFTGAVAPTEVPGLLAAADVGIIPHHQTEVTVGMSPLKAYEYLGAGLPVVATDLPPLRDLNDRVVLCSSPADFEAGVRQALQLGRASHDARQAFVRENSWETRGAQLLDFCRQVAGS